LINEANSTNELRIRDQVKGLIGAASRKFQVNITRDNAMSRITPQHRDKLANQINAPHRQCLTVFCEEQIKTDAG